MENNLSDSKIVYSNPNPAYGNCTCDCHNEDLNISIIHCMPCCYPEDDNKED